MCVCGGGGFSPLLCHKVRQRDVGMNSKRQDSVLYESKKAQFSTGIRLALVRGVINRIVYSLWGSREG